MNNGLDGSRPPRRGRVGRPSIPPEEKRCTAKSKQRQDRCRNYRANGFTVCEDHGGRTPVGIASPHFKDGRYSRLLPKKLQERFETLVADPDMLNLSRDMALLDVRLEQLLARLDQGESETGWRRAKDAFVKLRGAMASGDAQAVRDLMASLQEIFTAAVADDHTWRDVRDTVQERRLIGESERRRLVDLHQMVTVEELMIFASKLVSIVNRLEPDPAIRTAIALEVRGLLGSTGHGPRVSAAAVVDARSRTVPGENGRV